MKLYQHAILTHGGTSSDPHESDGPLSAAKIGMALMDSGASALDAVIHAVKYLEDDPRFNAGTGSQIRVDGHTIQLDASCMTSEGEYGAVACIEGVKNPIDVAQAVLLHSPHILLAGKGARLFAHEQKIPITAINHPDERKNQEGKITPSCDTVGAVAFDGITFAAALSSGGVKQSAIGRVGDVPLPGCGLFCGPMGTIACTGDGEVIALKILAREVYGWIEQNMSPDDAAKKAMTLFDDTDDIGLIILTKNECASNSRDGMAWSELTLNK